MRNGLQEAGGRPGSAGSREAEAGGIMSTGRLALSLQYLATDPYSARTPLHVTVLPSSDICTGSKLVKKDVQECSL